MPKSLNSFKSGRYSSLAEVDAWLAILTADLAGRIAADTKVRAPVRLQCLQAVHPEWWCPTRGQCTKRTAEQHGVLWRAQALTPRNTMPAPASRRGGGGRACCPCLAAAARRRRRPPRLSRPTGCGQSRAQCRCPHAVGPVVTLVTATLVQARALTTGRRRHPAPAVAAVAPVGAAASTTAAAVAVVAVAAAAVEAAVAAVAAVATTSPGPAERAQVPRPGRSPRRSCWRRRVPFSARSGLRACRAREWQWAPAASSIAG